MVGEHRRGMHFDENEYWLPGGYSGNRVSQGIGKSWGEAQSEAVITLRNCGFYEWGGWDTKLPHTHASTIRPLSPNSERLSNNRDNYSA